VRSHWIALGLVFERFGDLAPAEPKQDPARSEGPLMNAITSLPVK
jgi:hypothetical protein